MSFPGCDSTRPVAALYDVHGNLPALEAALAVVEHAGADQIIIGGDVVLGPMPRETLERVLALGPRVRGLRGNCDRLVVDAYDGRPLPSLPPAVHETILWTVGQLDRAHRDALDALPATLAAEVSGLGVVLFCHATPRSDEEIVTVRTPAERVRSMLAGVTAQVVVCGHTHLPMDRAVDGVRLVNAGSVGMPYGVPGAHWLLLGPDVRPMHTGYDLEIAAARIRATAYPQAAAFAERHVLQPDSAQAALDLLEPRPEAGHRPDRDRTIRTVVVHEH